MVVDTLILLNLIIIIKFCPVYLRSYNYYILLELLYINKTIKFEYFIYCIKNRILYIYLWIVLVSPWFPHGRITKKDPKNIFFIFITFYLLTNFSYQLNSSLLCCSSMSDFPTIARCPVDQYSVMPTYIEFW